MSLFTYRALNAAGKTVRGRMDAANLVDLELRLKRVELELVHGEESGTRRKKWQRRVSRKDLTTFFIHLQQMSEASVPVLDSLADLRDGVDNPRLRDITAAVIEGIQGGKRLSEAMADHPQAFDLITITLVRSGEETGNLAEVFKTLTESLKWEDELAEQTKRMLLYPLFMFVVICAVFLFLMLYLVPQLASFFGTLGQQTPLQTRILIATSNWLRAYWWTLPALPLTIFGVMTALARGTYTTRKLRDGLQLRMPYFGNILHKLMMARFASLFAMMYRSGITVLAALQICEGAINNLVIREALQRARLQIEEGSSVSIAFQNAGFFPSLVIRMLKIGESTGRLDSSLESVSYFFNREVKDSIARLQVMIEPALTVFMGLILGWLMLATFGPIYDVIGKLRL